MHKGMNVYGDLQSSYALHQDNILEFTWKNKIKQSEIAVRLDVEVGKTQIRYQVNKFACITH
jgi:hypothetical protein